MSRSIPINLVNSLSGPATTYCFILKIMPRKAAAFGLTSLDFDVAYDDGGGMLTYRAKRGYTALDHVSNTNLSVDNSEAHGLVAEYAADGVTLESINDGAYDGAYFVQYLIDYENPAAGHVVVNSGRVGEVRQIDDLACIFELRALTQVLKQNAIIELTSITCRAAYGDAQCKMPFRWFPGTVSSVGTETDRVFSAAALGAPGGVDVAMTDVSFFTGDGTTTTALLKDTAGNTITSGYSITDVKVDGASVSYTDNGAGQVTFAVAPASGANATWDGTAALTPDGSFSPGVVYWLTGDNAGTEFDIEEFDSTTQTFTLLIPTYRPIQNGDTFRVRRDCNKSKAMCMAYGNYLNFRGEAELPRANGLDLQAPTPGN